MFFSGWDEANEVWKAWSSVCSHFWPFKLNWDLWMIWSHFRSCVPHHFLLTWPKLEVFSHWACWASQRDECRRLHLWNWLLMHIVRLHHYQCTPPHFKLKYLWRRAKFHDGVENSVTGWYLCQRGERCGLWDGFELPAALWRFLWWQIPIPSPGTHHGWASRALRRFSGD